MKVQPIAFNHIYLHLDNGEIIDVNDGTSSPSYGILSLTLSIPSDKSMAIKESNLELIKIEFKEKK